MAGPSAVPTAVIHNAFSKGELSHALFARTDLAAFKVGAATMRNFFVDYRGGATNRAGSLMVIPCRDWTTFVNLIPFQFKTTQTYMLLFENLSIRVIKDGGPVLETAKAVPGISGNSLIVASTAGLSVGDWMFWTGLIYLGSSVTPIPIDALNNYYYKIRQIVSGTSLILEDLDGNLIDLSLYTTPSISNYGRLARVYTIVSPYVTADLQSLKYTQKDDVLTITHVNYAPRDLTRTAHDAWTLSVVAFAASLSPPATASATASAAGAAAYGYVVTSVASSGEESTASAIASLPNAVDISATAGSTYITWAPVTAAAYFNVYKAGPVVSNPVPTGASYGFIGGATGTEFADNNILQDFSQQPPTHTDPFAGGNNPGTTTYFQQRKVYAGSLANPQSLWLSKPGAFDNFDESIPIRDDDAIEESLFSNQVNDIQYMVAMPGGLLVFTGAGAWQINGGGQDTAITANSITAIPQAYTGIHNRVPPIVINYNIIYIPAKGSLVRDLAYNFFVNIYTGEDITVLSAHLFTGYQIESWCYADEPHKIVWAARSDGRMLSLTYLKEQEMKAWAHHDTFGKYISLGSIPEIPEDAVYSVVRRFINGRWIQFAERFASRIIGLDGVDGCWLLDCAIRSELTMPAATLTVSSAIGENVSFTADPDTPGFPIFYTDSVGSVIRMWGGIATITSYVSPTEVIADIIVDIQNIIPDDPNGDLIPFPAETEEWSMTPTSTVFRGLNHLEGMTVVGLGDGNVYEGLVVENGAVTFPVAVSRALVGLAYQCQLASMYADFGEPTQQGSRKNIPLVVGRVLETRGIKFGGTGFVGMKEFKQRTSQSPFTLPLFDGDEEIYIDGRWDIEGQVTAQQDYPLPATVLGFIPDILEGDVSE